MVVDRESLDTLGTSVDESETVSFSACECEFGQPSIRYASVAGCGCCSAVRIAFAVDQVVVGGWCTMYTRGL